MQRFSEEFGFDVLRADAFSEEEISADLTILLIVSGNAQMQIGDAVFEFKIDDIACVNQGIARKISGASPDFLVAEARFGPRFLSKILKEENPFFFCNSASMHDTSFSELRNAFYSLMHQYVYKKHCTECYEKSVLLRILDELAENFRIDKQGDGYRGTGDDERLRKLIVAVNTSFRYDTSLRSLAKRMGTSASTLSRLFKKKTGLYFADYVSSVRAKHALNALLNTDAPLTQIALDSGFANSSVFTAVFRRLYGKTPSAIREAFSAKEKAETESGEMIRQSLLASGLFSCDGENSGDSLKIGISGNESGTPYKKFWNTTINMGPMYALTLADVQSHILELHERLGFTTVRVWNIFSKRLMVGGGKNGFNFDKINQVLDFLTEHHLRPFLDFGRRPDMAVSADRTVFFQHECIEFATKADWESFMISFMRNATRRYGIKEVSTWLFDITRNSGHFEETPYWNDDGYCFFDAWKITRETIKAFCEDAKVGGISGMIDEDAAFLFSFYQACRDEECVPDFLSFILFPYESKERERLQSAGSEQKQADFILNVREKSGLSGVPIYITEWNNSISNRNILNDSAYRSSYIVSTVLALWGKVDMLALLMGSDLVSSFEDSVGVVNGGIGLLTKNAIRKPAYHAFEFLHLIPDVEIMRDKNFIVCKKTPGSYFIICCNYKWFSNRYFMQSEDVDKDTDFSTLNENNKKMRVTISFSGASLANDTRFRIKKRIVNEESGNIVAEWKKLRFAPDLTSQDISYLAAMSIPRLSLGIAESKNGTASYEFTMDAQEIAILECDCNR